MQTVQDLAYRLAHPLLRRVRSSRKLIRLFLGVRLPRGVRVDFDPTTLLLARAVRGVARPHDASLFEMGIGAGALVGLSAVRGTALSYCGADCLPRRVESARTVAAYNGVAAELFVSDLFDSVPPGRRFDLICFNPPYVPTAVGDRLGMAERLTPERPMWDGGEDGLVVLRRFLDEAPVWLNPGGRVLFGVQRVFAPDTAVRSAIDRSDWELSERITRGWIPSVVYVLRAGQGA